MPLAPGARFGQSCGLETEHDLFGKPASTFPDHARVHREGIMSAHESMEQAEHAEHASGENKKIALLIAVIALCLALSETLGKGAQTESISKNVEASNLWAFFQAKSIRRTVVEAVSEQAKLSLGVMGDDAAKAALQKQIDAWQKTAARYRSEPETKEGSEQLAERAKHSEEERDLAEAK